MEHNADLINFINGFLRKILKSYQLKFPVSFAFCIWKADRELFKFNFNLLVEKTEAAIGGVLLKTCCSRTEAVYVNFAKMLRTSCSQNTSGWPLLKKYSSKIS